MKTFRNILAGCMAALILTVGFPASSQTLTPHTYDTESLNFQVVYHWGMIWKHAGNAHLSLKNTGKGYDVMFTGRTISWANSIYPVSDTLRCSMDYNFIPDKYQKFTHEGKYYGHDVVDFDYANNVTTGKTTLTRKDKPVRIVTLTTQGKAYDMVSAFYVLRSLDFTELSKTKSTTMVVFSGKKKETLTIKYVGIEHIQLRDKSRHQAYKVKFVFTQDGRKKSSDDITAWISCTRDRKPLLMVGKLPVGEIKVYYAQNG